MFEIIIDSKIKNKKNIIGKAMPFLEFQRIYLNSESSFAQYRLTSKERSIVNFL